MALSPSHKLGQIIGFVLESVIDQALRPLAANYGLYLDKQGPRPARNARKKVTWVDDLGNKHDLDYVLERGGSAEVVGAPAAFIESA